MGILMCLEQNHEKLYILHNNLNFKLSRLRSIYVLNFEMLHGTVTPGANKSAQTLNQSG